MRVSFSGDAVSAMIAAGKVAAKRASRAIWAGGTSPFEFDLVPLDRKAAPPSVAHDPDAVEAGVREIRIRRGGVPKPKATQGTLDL